MPHFRDYWFIIIKRKKIIAISIICFVLFSLFSAQRQEPVYEARAKIMIAIGEDIVTSRGRVFGVSYSDLRNSEKYDNEYEVMRSPAVSETAAKILGWNEKKDADYIRSAVEISPVYAGYNVTNVAFVAARSSDPKKAMDMANAAAKAYMEINENEVRDKIKKTYSIYSEQLEELKNKLRDSEESLNKFRKEHGMIGIEDIKTTDEVTQQIKQNLEKELLDLLAVYTEKHPLVIQKRVQIEELLKYSRHDFEAASGSSPASKSNDADKGKAKSEYYALKQDVLSNRALYENLIGNMKELNVFEQMSRVGDVKVLEWAAAPSSPEKTKNMLLLFAPFVGFFIGLCLAFFREYMDTTLRTAVDVERHLELSVIGVITHMENDE